jgi:hypothetical protein
MNYRKGFWRIGVVLSLVEIAFWGGMLIAALISAAVNNTPVPLNWRVFGDSILGEGVLPVGGYWLLYWVLGWIIAGFRHTAKAPK